MTSYLAIEPGVRPSTEGFGDEEAYGVGGLGMVGTGSGGGSAGHAQMQTFGRGSRSTSRLRATSDAP